MAKRTLLEFAQELAETENLSNPAPILGSSDPQAKEIRKAAELAGDYLMEQFVWEFATYELEFTVAEAEDQGDLYTLFGQDYLKIIPETFWNVTSRLRIYGPLTDNEWQMFKIFAPASGINHFRIMGHSLLLRPAPSTSFTATVLYQKNLWILGPDDVRASRFLSDGDIVLFDDKIFSKMLQSEWRRMKGFDFQTQRTEAIAMAASNAARSNASRTLHLDNMGDAVQPGVIVTGINT